MTEIRMTDEPRTVRAIVIAAGQAIDNYGEYNRKAGIAEQLPRSLVSEMEGAIWDLIDTVAQTPGVDLNQVIHRDVYHGSRANEFLSALKPAP